MRDQARQFKDRSQLREGDSAWEQWKSNRGVLKDYSLKHKVSMEWDMNPDSINDRIFKLKVDDYEVVLDWEEVLRTGRFV